MRVSAASQRAGARLGVRAARIAAGAADEDGDAARIDGRTDSLPAALMFRRDALSIQQPGSTPGTPARLRGRRLRRQVSWLADRRLRAAFPGRQCPVAIGRSAHRLQLRGQPRIWGRPRTAFPLSPSLCGGGTVAAAFRPRAAMPVNARGFRFADGRNFGYELPVGGSRKGAKRECGEDFCDPKPRLPPQL